MITFELDWRLTEVSEIQRNQPGAKRSNAPKIMSIAAPIGLAYFAYRTPRFEVSAKAAAPKITRLLSMKKKTYSRM